MANLNDFLEKNCAQSTIQFLLVQLELQNTCPRVWHLFSFYITFKVLSLEYVMLVNYHYRNICSFKCFPEFTPFCSHRPSHQMGFWEFLTKFLRQMLLIITQSVYVQRPPYHVDCGYWTLSLTWGCEFPITAFPRILMWFLPLLGWAISGAQLSRRARTHSRATQVRSQR